VLAAASATGAPKSADGRVQMIRVLRSARRSAVKARGQAANQLKALVVTAPEDLRDRLRRLSTGKLVARACRLRPGTRPETPEAATKLALRSVARRHVALSEEIAELDAQLDRLVAEAAPELLALPAVGTDHAATLLTLLIVAGENPERLRSEASFASLCGASPVEASSGKVVRHRLNKPRRQPGRQPGASHDLHGAYGHR
jgi:transposase